MKALKGLFIYIGIVLAMLLGLCMFLFGIMYFVPSFRILGVGVTHVTTSESDVVCLDDYSGVTDIELNVNGKNLDYSVTPYVVEEDEPNNLLFGIDVSVFGISTDVTENRIVKSVKVDGNTLKVNLTVTETNGLLSISGNGIYINIPNEFTYDLFLNSNSADISLGNSDVEIDINTLSVTTGSGSLMLNNIGKGEEEKSLTLNSLNLKTGTGNFDFKNIKDLTVNNTVQLTAEDGDFKFTNLYADIDVKGTGVRLDAAIVECRAKGFSFLSENGYFNISKLSSLNGSENMIVTENCDINISEIVGRTGINTEYGNINITTMNDDAILSSVHGNVFVKKAMGSLNIVSEFGDITVEEYYKDAYFENVKGNITVNSKSEYVQNMYTKIINVDGDIRVKNKVNKLLIEGKGDSMAYVEFEQIKDGLDETTTFQHQIKLASTTRQSSIYIPVYNQTVPFKFIATGNISGEIWGFSGVNGGTNVVSSHEWQYWPSSSNDNVARTINSCYFYFDGYIKLGQYANI